MKLFFTYIVLLLFTANLYSQNITSSVSNTLRYGSGTENFGEAGMVAKLSKEYFDNITDARLNWSNLSVGFRLEYAEPAEYGLSFRGLSKKYIEFEKDGLSIRAGDSYALFSRGLSLNLFENRTLAFDTGLEGLYASYKSRSLSAQLLIGEIEYFEPLTLYDVTPRFEFYTLRAASIEATPVRGITLGANYVWAEAKTPSLFFFDQQDTSKVKIPELFTRLRLGSFDFYAAYALKLTSFEGVNDSVKGSAFYTSISHYGKGYGITFEYKDYRFDIVDPIERSIFFRPTRMLPIQNPPIVHKEHSYTSLTRYPHVVDFNDEVGFQIDAFFSINPDITINLNAAMSSRHYAYEFDENFQVQRKQIGSPLFPSLNEERSPYWELHAEAEYFFKGNESFVKLGINRRSEIIYESLFLFHPSQPHRLTTIPAQVQYVFNREWSVKFTTESQWAFIYPNEEKFYNHILGLQVAKAPNISLGVLLEMTTDDSEPEEKKFWAMIEGSYRIGTSHTLTLSYGEERGGLLCSNGLCRQVLPFSGFRFSIVSSI